MSDNSSPEKFHEVKVKTKDIVRTLHSYKIGPATFVCGILSVVF